MARKGLKFDVALCLGVLALVGAGMVLIYSSSAPYALIKGRPESFYLVQHLKRVLVGLIAFLAAMAVPYRFWERLALPLALAGLSLLAFIFLLDAATVNGARRWIFGVQPSEPVKLAMILYLARRLGEKAASGEMATLGRGLIASLVLPLAAFLLILMQPNFSTALALMGISLVLIFAAGARPAHLLLLGGIALPAALALMVSSPYRMRRVLSFLDPSSNPAGSHQGEQALISLGNGGLIGTGLGEGTQKLGYLPMPFTDTVFAILGEELGFAGSMGVLALFGLVVWRGLRVARDCPDRFGSLLAAGLSASIAINVVVHVGVCAGLFPTTGQPLPFVSYGGTSLIVNLVGMGILLNVSSAAAVPAESPPPLVWRAARRTTPLRPYGPRLAAVPRRGRA